MAAHFCWRVRLNACFTADVLLGRGVLRMCGRLADVLEQPSAAAFVTRSAFLFPGMSLWLEIHFIEMLLYDQVIAALSACIRYWPEDEPFVLSAKITNWLSRNSETFFPIVSMVFSIIQITKMAPPRKCCGLPVCLDKLVTYLVSWVCFFSKELLQLWLCCFGMIHLRIVCSLLHPSLLFVLIFLLSHLWLYWIELFLYVFL